MAYRSDSSSATSVSAFGEPVSVEIQPVIQIDAIYDTPSRVYLTANSAGAVATSSNTTYIVSSGTSANGGGMIRTRNLFRYRSGQGALARFTAAYSTPDANTQQIAGFHSTEQALVVGYNGTQFGICRRNGGKVDIHQLTLTANATVASNCTITLDGVATNVALSIATTQVNAKEIAATNFGADWYVEATNSTVTFVHRTVGLRSGSFSYSAGTTGSAGTMSAVQVGANHTDNWVYQANWNLDTLDGTGSPRNPSKMLLDPAQLNVYQINFRWLGVGVIRYAIENQTTGAVNFFHVEHYTNQHTTPHLDNPSFHLAYAANNISSGTSANTTVSGVCALVANEGVRNISHYTLGATSGKKAGLTQDTLHNLISLRNNRVYQNKLNLRNLRVKHLSVATQGNDPLEVFFYLNPTPNTVMQWTAEGLVESGVSYSNSAVSYTFTNETPLAAFTVPANGAGDYELDHLNIEIAPRDIVTVAVRSGQSITTVAGSLTWVED